MMSAKTIATAVAVVTAAMIGLAAPERTEAHFVKPKQLLSDMPEKQQIVYWHWSSKHYKYKCYESNVMRIRKNYCKAWKWALRRKVQSQREYLNSLLPPHAALWNCVHRHEATWYDDGSPYWGGLQMGSWFHSNYGGRFLNSIFYRKGYANNWTPFEQMWVAELAYREAGYGNTGWLNGQWPNTTSECPGLY